MAPVRERAAACFVLGRSSFWDCPVASKVFLFHLAPLCFSSTPCRKLAALRLPGS